MPSGLYFVSEFLSFAFSFHFVYSNTIYDTIFSVHSMTLTPFSTTICCGKFNTREQHYGRAFNRGYKYHTVYRAFEILGNITKRLVLIGCIQLVQHNDWQTDRRSTQSAITWREVPWGMVLQGSTLRAHKNEASEIYPRRETPSLLIVMKNFLGLFVTADFFLFRVLLRNRE
jgi:hypothetical protein